MITQRESKQIVDFVIKEIKRRQFPYITDGKIDLSKTTVGAITGGTSISGGQLSDEFLYDRHVNPNAEINATKVQVVGTPGYFGGNVEEALYELVDYIDGGNFVSTYAGAIESHRFFVDGGAFTSNEIINGGSF